MPRKKHRKTWAERFYGRRVRLERKLIELDQPKATKSMTSMVRAFEVAETEERIKDLEATCRHRPRQDLRENVPRCTNCGVRLGEMAFATA